MRGIVVNSGHYLIYKSRYCPVKRSYCAAYAKLLEDCIMEKDNCRHFDKYRRFHFLGPKDTRLK